ncbi:hypothetical protein COL922a_013172 [Colletotrichum nupharicola]|nr:hypothetical protein COL922a_013172 [Colletotrichum nupharicola]
MSVVKLQTARARESLHAAKLTLAALNSQAGIDNQRHSGKNCTELVSLTGQQAKPTPTWGLGKDFGTETAAKKVAVITTSTRKVRIGPKVAEIVKNTISQDASTNKIDLALVEVAKFNLPVYDEVALPAQVPAVAKFEHAHSIAWSEEIAKYDGYILVVPEYNYGMAGGTKNAIDYLYNEWIGKPAAVVSYGIAGGNRASEQVKGTLEGMKLRVAATRPALSFAGGAGSDLVAAIKGEVGEDSRKDWEAKSEDILKAFGELKQLLSEPPAPKAPLAI